MRNTGNLSIASLLLSLLLLSGTVAAEERHNVYIDANLSVSQLGFNLNAGYMFNDYLGLEGGVSYLPSYAYCDGSCKSYYMVDTAIKGVLPLASVFSLYGKLGVGLNEYSAPVANSGYVGSQNVGILLGAGAQFNLSKQWSLHIEDNIVTGGNPNLLMLGAQFKF